VIAFAHGLKGAAGMRRWIVALFTFTIAVGVLPDATAAPTGDLIRVKARLRCLDTGGARVTLWVRNIADQHITISPDIHFMLTLIRGDEHEPGPIVFMTPVPDFAELDPHAFSRFVIPMGEAFEGEPGLDLSADRLRLRVETYLAGHIHPAVDRQVFPGCAPPIPPPPLASAFATP
jgi:hypothetical protein